MILTPKKTNIVLIIITILIAGSTIFFAYFTHNLLGKEAVKINQKHQKLKESESNTEKLALLKKQLAEIEDVPRLLENLITIKKKNLYQERSIEVMRDYAKKSGLTISRISFVSSKVSKSKTTMQFQISLNDKVDYSKILKFITLTESSLLRMQITEMSINQAAESEGVTVKGLKINVYVKENN